MNQIPRIRVITPGRLHLGFIDMSGSSGRRFGSVGLTVDGLDTDIELSAARGKVDEVSGSPESAHWLATAKACAGCDDPLRLTVRDQPPAHAGFGSGTQLAMAIGSAVFAACGEARSAADIARLMQRGRRSGIGIGAFERGGFIIDGGHGPATDVPPVTVRLPFPVSWRVLLVLDPGDQGLSGPAEVQAFHDLPPFPARQAQRLAHALLTGALPALVEQDLATFGAVITDLQAAVGDHFASVQGARFRHPGVAGMLAWLASRGAHAIGQSSWGPTGFAIIGDADAADRITRDFDNHPLVRQYALRLMVTTGNNHGARLERLTSVIPTPQDSS